MSLLLLYLYPFCRFIVLFGIQYLLHYCLLLFWKHWNMAGNFHSFSSWNIKVVSFFLRWSALLYHAAVYQSICISHPVIPTTTLVCSPWSRVAVWDGSLFNLFMSFYISNTVTTHPVFFLLLFFSSIYLLSSLLLGAGNTADVSCDNTLLTRLTILTGLCQHIQFINMAQTPPSCSIAFRG